jgi:hypothetical protein
MTRRLLALLFALALPASADCLIHGTVTDADTGETLSAGRVLAKPVQEAKAAILRVTDAHGSFCFDRLDAGEYTLMVQRPGYVPFVYGARPGATEGIVLPVDGVTAAPSLKLPLTQAASISGTVLDSAGEPIEAAGVKLLRKAWDRNARRWDSQEMHFTHTDDRGAFRFAPLAPGTYYFSVDGGDQRSGLDEKGHPAPGSGPVTYYGGSVTFDHATPVELAAGRDAGNLTVTLARSPGRNLIARVRPDAKPAGQEAWLTASLKEGGRGEVVKFDESGVATIHNLRPGLYKLGTSNFSANFEKDVDLTNGDADVTLEEPKQYEVRISVKGTNGSAGLMLSARNIATGDENPCDGRNDSFICSLGAGQYWLQIDASQGYVKSLTGDGKSRPDALVDLGKGQPESVQVEIASNFAKVIGQLQRNGDAPADLAVTIVWMDEAHPYAEDRNGSTAADHAGKFALEKLPPGKYRLFAIEGFDDDLWGSAELASMLKGKSLEVELREGQAGNAELPVISAGEWVAALRKVGM